MTILLKYLFASAIAFSTFILLKPAQALTLISTSEGQVGQIDAQTGTFTGLTSGRAYSDIALTKPRKALGKHARRTLSNQP